VNQVFKEDFESPQSVLNNWSAYGSAFSVSNGIGTLLPGDSVVPVWRNHRATVHDNGSEPIIFGDLTYEVDIKLPSSKRTGICLGSDSEGRRFWIVYDIAGVSFGFNNDLENSPRAVKGLKILEDYRPYDGNWHRWKAQVRGEQLDFWIDNHHVATGKVDGYLPGQIGMRSWDSGGAQFDNLSAATFTGSVTNPETPTLSPTSTIVITPAPVIPTPAAGSQLKYGDVILGGMNPGGEIDKYTFTGKAGDQIVVAVTETGEQANEQKWFDLSVEVLGPSGQSIAKSNAGFNVLTARVMPVLPSDGRYSIIIQEPVETSFGPHSGPYTLILKNISADAGISISYNSTTNEELNPGGDVDIYTFDGQAGDMAFITITELGEQANEQKWFDLSVEVLDPNGNSIAKSDAGFNILTARVNPALPMTGRYTIIILEPTNTDFAPHIGPYTLTLNGP
jgi:hypothetical protein